MHRTGQKKKNRISQANVYYINGPPQFSGNTNPPQPQSYPPTFSSNDPNELAEDEAADIVLGLKRSSSFNVPVGLTGQQLHQFPIIHPQRYSASERSNSVMKVDEDHSQKVLIHRLTDEGKEHVVKMNESSERSTAKTSLKRKFKEEDDSDSIDEGDNEEDQEHGIDFSAADIVFANGNNREKRRIEVFEYYSKLYQYKEQHRDMLYKSERARLLKRLEVLSKARDFNTGVAELQDCGDQELFELEHDIVELRDLELTRLRYWRRFQRNANIKLFYEDSNKLYNKVTETLDQRLEKLKQFFTKQKLLLTNLDRDMSDITSIRATKLYSGFIKEEEPDDKEESSETDTSTNSKRRTKNTGHLLSSIVDGFAPISSSEEFLLIVGDDFNTRTNQDYFPREAGSDSESNTGNEKKRSSTNSSATRGGDKDTSAMNKIMKNYTSPDDLKVPEIEQDLALLRSLKP